MNRTMAFTVIVGITLVLTLGGCAHGPSDTMQLIKFPELNAKSEAQVGESMVSTAWKRIIHSTEIVIDKDIAHNSPECKVTISAGVLPFYMSDKEGSFYRMKDDVPLTVLGIPNHTSGGVYFPNDKSKPTEVFCGHWRKPFPFVNKARAVHPGIEFKLAPDGEKWEADSFKRELVYSGISQNTLSILYREFMFTFTKSGGGYTARPAFSQELKYDLSQGNTIGYKGARFQVIKATNTGIKYEVLKHLD